MMRVRPAGLLAALLLALLLAACGQPAPKGPPPSPAIWQVTAPGGQQGWLFGTIHALPDGATWRTPPVDGALRQAGLLVVEVGDLEDGHAGPREFARVSQSDGLPPLLSRVAPEYRQGLQAALDEARLKEGDLARMESWAAALMISNGLRQSETGNGVDRALLALPLPVLSLEGYAAQFALFDTLAEQDQRVLLTELARDTASGAAEREEREVTAAWIAGDMARLEREDHSGILADPELREALLVGRNRAWAARIAPLLDQGRRPFVAVGAAHMAGPDGLPALLAARGYRVQRLR